MSTGNNYILISPVKDEEKYISRTIAAVLRQRVRPSQWIIVDDGSRDRTKMIVAQSASQHPWMRVISLPTDPARKPGSGIIKAFNAGYDVIRDVEYDFIVKFDCDIDFPSDYFEKLMDHFRHDERLGIASGIYLEQKGGVWSPIPMPAYHAAGQTKVVRRECFRDIGGFVASRGWDTVDEIRAQAKGWETRHFKDLHFFHLKKEGTGIGLPKTNIMHGEIYYLTGGSGTFFLFKLLHRLLFGTPFLVGGLLMLWGFAKASFSHRSKLVTQAEEKLYRRLLKQRIANRLFQLCHVRN